MENVDFTPETMFQFWSKFVIPCLPKLVGPEEYDVLLYAARLSWSCGFTKFSLPRGMQFGDVGPFSCRSHGSRLDPRLQYYDPAKIRKAVSSLIRAGVLFCNRDRRKRETEFIVNLPGILRFAKQYCPDAEELSLALTRVEQHYRHEGVSLQDISPTSMGFDTK